LLKVLNKFKLKKKIVKKKMSIGREEAEKIIKDFNNIAPIKANQVPNGKSSQEKNEVKSGKSEGKADEEKKPGGKKTSNMKLIIIVTVIIIILVIGIYLYMYPGPKGKLMKKVQNPPVTNPAPVQTASQ